MDAAIGFFFFCNASPLGNLPVTRRRQGVTSDARGRASAACELGRACYAESSAQVPVNSPIPFVSLELSLQLLC